MVDFAEIADIVADVVVDEGLGATVTYTSVTGSAYDPATGTTVPTGTTETVSAIIDDPRGVELLSGLAQAGDKTISIPAELLTATPKPTDSITVGAETYAVIRVENEQAGGVIILHVLHCRRA